VRDYAGRFAQRMKLCFLGWGDHIHVERWAAYFARAGHDVSVISMTGRGHYPAGVKQYILGMEKRGARWKILRLRWLLALIRPDVVHVHWAYFSYFAARATSRPLVVTAWGSDVYRTAEQDVETVRQLCQGLQSARFITCDSLDQRSQLSRFPGVDEAKVHVVQWGVDVRMFHPGPPNPSLLTALGLAGRRVVLSARKLFPIYNQETIIAAFLLVRRRVPDAVLLMKDYHSDPNYVHGLQRLIDENGLQDSVLTLGAVPYEQVADLYRLASVSVSMPFSDGTSMSVLEAMACGSAPIVSDLPSLREWIREGWNGHLVAPNDKEVLAERIVNLLEDTKLRETFATRNLEIIRERADQAENMARMGRLYRDAAGQAAGLAALCVTLGICLGMT
jgi:glycosyltransferase involved in cell wall biosynthesis